MYYKMFRKFNGYFSVNALNLEKINIKSLIRKSYVKSCINYRRK
jgi:hypothetical protein